MPPLPFLSPIATVLAVATGLSAQIAPSAYSAGVVVQAGPVTSTVLLGNQITTGAQLVAAGAVGSAAFDYSPSWDVTAVDLVFDISSNALAHIGTSSGGATRHELWSPRSIDGRFVITWTSAVSGTGTASFGLDLFDDGTIDATASTVLAGTLPAGLTTLRVHTSASANAGVVTGPWGIQIPYQGAAQGRLTIRFEPTHCASVPYAQACSSGPTTSVVGNFLGGVTLGSQCAPANELAILVLGVDQVPNPLPLAPFCTLHTTPLATLWQPVPTTGRVTWSTSLPVGFGPVAFAAQVVALDVDAWSATTGEAFWISCQ